MKKKFDVSDTDKHKKTKVKYPVKKSHSKTQNNHPTKNKEERNLQEREKSNAPKYDLNAMPYEKQLEYKQKWVNSLLEQFGKVGKIIGMENPYHYRHKVNASFGEDKKGNILYGTYEEGSHRIVRTEKCNIEHPKARAIIDSIAKLLPSFKIRPYDEDRGYGLLRHVLIRIGEATGEIMVILVLAAPILPSKNNFVKAILKEHPEITTILINVNNKKTSMILGDKEQIIYGKGYIEDVLCEKHFKISAKSFYQVNPIQTKKLYARAIEMADLKGNEVLLDAYCGTGTIGIIASSHVKEVVGVELNADAVKDAIYNARKNQVKNIHFYQADAGDFMMETADYITKNREGHIDVVLMDPPRTGSSPEFLNALCRLSPKKVIYISCNPETLARDLKVLTQRGYEMKSAIPVDMFPFTEHCECVTLLTETKNK